MYSDTIIMVHVATVLLLLATPVTSIAPCAIGMVLMLGCMYAPSVLQSAVNAAPTWRGGRRRNAPRLKVRHFHTRVKAAQSPLPVRPVVQPPVRQAPPELAIFSDDEDGDSTEEEHLSPAARWLNDAPIDGLDCWYSTTSIKIDGMTYPSFKATTDQLMNTIQQTMLTSIDQAALLAAECMSGPGCACLEIRFLFRGQPTVAGVNACVRHLFAEATKKAAETNIVDEFSLMGAALALAEVSPGTSSETMPQSSPPSTFQTTRTSENSAPSSPRAPGTTVPTDMSRSRRKSRAYGRQEAGPGVSLKCESCELWFGPKTRSCTMCSGTLMDLKRV